MTILLYFLIPVTLIAAYALYGWLRTRQPSSVESGVDAFRREMTALSPDAAPSSRRPDLDPEAEPIEQGQRPQRSEPHRPPAVPEQQEPRQTPRRPGTSGPEGDR